MQHLCTYENSWASRTFRFCLLPDFCSKREIMFQFRHQSFTKEFKAIWCQILLRPELDMLFIGFWFQLSSLACWWFYFIFVGWEEVLEKRECGVLIFICYLCVLLLRCPLRPLSLASLTPHQVEDSFQGSRDCITLLVPQAIHGVPDKSPKDTLSCVSRAACPGGIPVQGLCFFSSLQTWRFLMAIAARSCLLRSCLMTVKSVTRCIQVE